MTTQIWVFGFLGLIVAIGVYDVSTALRRTNTVLESIAEELAFANKDKRAAERAARY